MRYFSAFRVNRINEVDMDPRYRVLNEALNVQNPVGGLTHDYYRYPARFSPEFARACIREFTRPHDVVIDPFMGGGTTLV